MPERAIEVLLEAGDTYASDFLIADEIQDLAIDSYLDVLDLMVKGGLSAGRVLLFGDFERQAIFENERGRATLRERIPHLPSFKLVQNCRNLPRIGYQVNLLGRLQPGYQRFRRQDDGIDPVLEPYSPGQDLSALLAKSIRNLKDDGFALNEIVVLSPRREDSTAATTVDPWLKQILVPADGLPAKPGRVLYSTIHAFKGLDAPAVVVTDLDEAAIAESFDSLLYVGLTRATDRLVAIIEAATLRHAIGAFRERT